MRPDARRPVTFDFIAMIQTPAAGIEWLHWQIVKSASYELALRVDERCADASARIAGLNGPDTREREQHPRVHLRPLSLSLARREMDVHLVLVLIIRSCADLSRQFLSRL